MKCSKCKRVVGATRVDFNDNFNVAIANCDESRLINSYGKGQLRRKPTYRFMWRKPNVTKVNFFHYLAKSVLMRSRLYEFIWKNPVRRIVDLQLCTMVLLSCSSIIWT